MGSFQETMHMAEHKSTVRIAQTIATINHNPSLAPHTTRDRQDHNHDIHSTSPPFILKRPN